MPKSIKIRQWLKRGSSDAVGFLLLSPIMIILIGMLFQYVKYTEFRQKLRYTAYFTCRAASVCENITDAKAKAIEIANRNLSKYNDVIDMNSINIDLSVIIGDGTKAGKQYEVLEEKKEKKSKKPWDKGNYISCKLTVKPKQGILKVKNEISTTVVMAIEHNED